MNIDWVIPCRFVEVHDNLATIVGGGIDRVWLPAVPLPVQVNVAIRASALHEDLHGGHTFRSIVRGPGDQVVSDISADFESSGSTDAPDYLSPLIIPTVVQFEAAEFGTHHLEFQVDEASSVVPLHVREAPTPP